VSTPDAPHTHPTVYVERKLPHVTALFWILKILAVTLGETGSDEFAIGLQLGYLGCAIAFALLFVLALAAQLRASRFRPATFWFLILSTSIVGTAVSDLMDRGLGHSGSVSSSGIGYGPGALILTSLLVVVFLVWRATGQTYDVENIATRKGEILYWIAILVSNTLGTASGDWLADDVGLGFVVTFALIAAVMAVLLVAHYATSINSALLFWPAFVLTRPLSAAAGDSLTKPPDDGGLGLGTLWGSLLLLVVLVVLITIQTLQVRRAPLDLLPSPVHRVTGDPLTPNGRPVLAHGPRHDQIVAGR
jgi:uncharacterized membrane-anchored protein